MTLTPADAVLRMAEAPGGVRLRDAQRAASDDPHTSARAIVRLLATGALRLTKDLRLVTPADDARPANTRQAEVGR